MAKREDIRKILIIGSGPIIIGQACEFDYSGTQACKALRAEGYDVVLVNSNPATIMTDPGMADHTYIEPLTVDRITAVIEKERPDALLPNLGGQTALNLASKLHEEGILKQYGVEVIGVDLEAIARGEDRIISRKPWTGSACRSPSPNPSTPWRKLKRWPLNWATPSCCAPPTPWAARAAASFTTWKNCAR